MSRQQRTEEPPVIFSLPLLIVVLRLIEDVLIRACSCLDGKYEKGLCMSRGMWLDEIWIAGCHMNPCMAASFVNRSHSGRSDSDTPVALIRV
jgi:hypothetical protein